MIYLNYAALHPTHPDAQRESTRTITEFKQFLYSDAGIEWYFRKVNACRQKVSKLLHISDPSTIAFCSNASSANYLTLSSIQWEPEDTVLTTTHENPSTTRQILALKKRGVHIYAIQPSSPDQFLESIRQALQQHSVKVIILSHVSHVDGRILPISLISTMAREQGAMFFVDGAQAVGQIPVNLDQLDFDVYFFTGHKWCAGPLGTGAMVLNHHFLNSAIRRPIQSTEGLTTQAAEFEIGTQNIGDTAGLAHACELKFTEGLGTEMLLKYRQKVKKIFEESHAVRFVEWTGPHAPGILTIQGFKALDYRRFAKKLAEESNIIIKPFVDYPQEILPALRLSWSTTMNDQDFQFGVEKIAGSFSNA